MSIGSSGALGLGGAGPTLRSRRATAGLLSVLAITLAFGCSTPSAASRRPLTLGETRLDLESGRYTVWFEFPCGHVSVTAQSFDVSVAGAESLGNRHGVGMSQPDGDGCMMSLLRLRVTEAGPVQIRIVSEEPRAELGEGSFALYSG